MRRFVVCICKSEQQVRFADSAVSKYDEFKYVVAFGVSTSDCFAHLLINYSISRFFHKGFYLCISAQDKEKKDDLD